jgi:hypothetical protein
VTSTTSEGPSQWCVQRYSLYETIDGEKVHVSGHSICRAKRWHTEPMPGHMEDEEAESWACGCPCHTGHATFTVKPGGPKHEVGNWNCTQCGPMYPQLCSHGNDDCLGRVHLDPDGRTECETCGRSVVR